MVQRKTNAGLDALKVLAGLWRGDQLWLCGLIPHAVLVGVREYDAKAKKL
jgi:hypothetical protein